MNRINHDNYEAFLLDMVEGTISAADREELMLFMAAHPELDMDLDGLEFATLDDEGISFPHKENLKKTEASRFDALAFKQLEEGLTAAEQQELDAIVASNKKYTKELAAFAQTVLVADTSIVFTGKEKLKQGAVIRPLWYVSLSAAAAVALLAGGFWLYQQNSGKQPAEFANALSNGKTLPTVTINPKVKSDIEQLDTFVQAQAPVKTIAPFKNTTVTPDNSTPAYAKSEPLYISPAQAQVAFEPTALDTDQPVTLYMAVPYIDIQEKKPTLLNTLMAGLRKNIDEGVKDEELAHRLDTITKRGPELSDLAFLGSKGFEKIAGFKPNFRRVEKNDNEVSSLSIGRYTIVATRPKRGE